MTVEEGRPWVGDEVMEGRTRAVVTDVRDGVLWLRRVQGGHEWPAQDPERLTVLRTRAQRIAAGEA
ncbi:hypothetical protein [Streptomyces sp. NPDC060366]|uniref:hypothetical protein n=1 Tax=Streptomyces sp. NPDC060366 TaxID=3347105 RepID=UPI00364B2353